ncbi:Zn-dependent peptidase, insulinase family [Lachnospiraceae bacterium TWA4]|nr:Zn-dependent peptidase, insulinase family [Lachnospiraceae bacterium TWA4]
MSSYEQIKQEYISELNSEAFILKHKKSGARIFFLSNDDENKVFTIGFRTPPKDSTGVAHILEHSVLCGSKKFPLKDPFVELVKGSLNTFLNAMTYSDKTVYPVASCNDKDFRNLTDVYLDAVLHPNIYQNKKIFLQEGWHYELEDVDDPLKVNGVVYNEMKGVYSSPESYLEYYMGEALFPDNTYAFESGGAPEHIPELSYEEFLAFHKKYYHPSNSYIYFYGNMDREETLAWLDENYLKDYDYEEIDSTIPKQETFSSPVTVTKNYPISAKEKQEENYLSWGSVVGDDLDKELYVAFQILEYALLSAPGAPLKQALLDAKIGKDVMGGYDSGILQPYFTVIAKDADLSKSKEFKEVIVSTLTKLVEEGIPMRSLRAALNFFEFKYREGDYGSYPKGLMFGLQCFDSWLYDENDPLMHLKYEDTFAYLKKQLDDETGYFEGLIKTWLLDNPHQALIIMSPKCGLLEENEKALADKLEAYKKTLSKEELEDLVKQTKELKLYQETPDSEETLRKLPMLTREDISTKTLPFQNEEKEVNGYKVVYHPLFTSGIGYMRVMFDTAGLTEEELLYVGLLKSVVGFVDTKNYSYQELFDEIHANSGGISPGVCTFDHFKELDSFIGTFYFYAKVLYEKIGFAFDMIKEMALCSNLRDDKRMYEILCQLKSRAQMRLVSAGHSSAVLRGSSYYSTSAIYSECVGGIRYYKFIEGLEKNFEDCKEELYDKLEALCKKIFSKERMLISYTADENGIAQFEKELPTFDGFYSEEKNYGPYFTCRTDAYVFTPCKLNEGFKASSQVQYVARCGRFTKEYTGALKILTVILNYEYLWTNLRVIGGAYGCMSGFARNGESYFASYRDPNLEKTNETFEGVSEYVANFDADERDMTKYVIGAISDMDIPKTQRTKGERSLSAYLTKTELSQLQKERNEVLTAQVSDIRALAPYMEEILATDALCVIGNETKVTENSELFKEVKSLFDAE